MGADNHERRARQRTGWKAHIESKTQLQGADLPSSWRSTSMKTHSLPRTLGFRGFASHQLGSSSLTLGLRVDTALGRVQYVSVIDRFQVSHFRPVVMEIEIGGRSEKSLGGQESAAVDQNVCDPMQARTVLASVFPQSAVFLWPEPVSCWGQRIARSNGKRSWTIELIFTKNISTYGHHFMRKNEYATTHQPAYRKICLTPIMCKDMHFQFLFSLLCFFITIQNTSSMIWWCSNIEPNKTKREHLGGSGLKTFCQIHVHIEKKKMNTTA